jgi:hypothetical protein
VTVTYPSHSWVTSGVLRWAGFSGSRLADQTRSSTVLDLSLAYVQRRQAFTPFPVIEAGKLVASQAFLAFVLQA